MKPMEISDSISQKPKKTALAGLIKFRCGSILQIAVSVVWA